MTDYVVDLKTLEMLATEAFMIISKAQANHSKRMGVRGGRVTDKETNIITSEVFRELVSLYKDGKLKISEVKP